MALPVSTSANINWCKCIFRKTNLPKCKTICQQIQLDQDTGCGYSSLAEAVNGFLEFNALPTTLIISKWDEGDGIAATCKRHSACWHKKMQNNIISLLYHILLFVVTHTLFQIATSYIYQLAHNSSVYINWRVSKDQNFLYMLNCSLPSNQPTDLSSPQRLLSLKSFQI